MRDASFAAIGAIALQGVRRAEPSLGERVVVVGLGLLGLITVQALRAAGCRVAGVEPVEKRRELARELGAELALEPRRGGRRRRWPGPTAPAPTQSWSRPRRRAATSSTRPCACCGAKGASFPSATSASSFDREALYEREADVLISTSYGPGPLRPVVRGGRARLPAAVRPLDRGPQHGGVPAARRRRASSRSTRSSSSSCRSIARPRRTRRSPATRLRWRPCSPMRNAAGTPRSSGAHVCATASRRTARCASRSSAPEASCAARTCRTSSGRTASA